ncbi:unnamed protein product [Adineta steineri]|uniref:Thioredoxin domain-containing protein n=1 Tax=Adineta steineri TaxID=433720 RepID=A0A815HRW5_9BILA|nr:unnamed protein product [Adineta steineri]CAF1356331.1 unnamed protein product [Adineta steineri]
MAVRTRLTYNTCKVLTTEEEVNKNLSEHDLVLLLFNKNSSSNENDIEQKFNLWRINYERTYELLVFKCVKSKIKNPLITTYNIINVPTFILFHKQQEVARLEDAENIQSDVISTLTADEQLETKDAEQQLKLWLDKNCEKYAKKDNENNDRKPN